MTAGPDQRAGPRRARPARVLVVQDGARLHYALPQALAEQGLLWRCYTDWYHRSGTLESLAARGLGLVLPSLARKMAGRRCPGLDETLFRTRPGLALGRAWDRLRGRGGAAVFRRDSQRVTRWIVNQGFRDATVLAGFIRNLDPDLCRQARDTGLKCVGDQIIAPAAVELRESRLQQERWPEWEADHSSDDVAPYESWERATWKQLDRVTCMSEYVRQGLLDQGVPAAKIEVIHYPTDVSRQAMVDRRGRSGPVTVGFLGLLSLRKGVPYFVEVAERLAGRGVRFVMVGPVAVESRRLREAGRVVEVVGPVPRTEVGRWLASWDVFLFPSTCEGSAGAVVEAMASGLPVVTTPNSGTFARNGVEGFLCRYDDIEAMAERVDRLCRDTDLRLSMGRAARARVESFNLQAYGQAWRRLLENLLSEG